MRLRLKLQNRVKWVLNPSLHHAFIPQFEVRINRRDKLTQRCGQVDVGKSSCWALYISLRCVLTPWNIWVACCSHSTCQNRFPLKWSVTFSNMISDFLFINRESTCSKKQPLTQHTTLQFPHWGTIKHILPWIKSKHLHMHVATK